VLTTAEMKVLEVREKYNCWFYLCWWSNHIYYLFWG
jgi:hypothetical protein